MRNSKVYFLAVLTLSWSALAEEVSTKIDLGLFKDSYSESRKDFVRLAGSAAHRFVFRKSADLDLGLDYAYWAAPGPKKYLILVNSGIHGIEGFVGSAVQRMWLTQVKNKPLPPQFGLLFIHGMNSFGFQNFRRVNEENVDLNRNFALTQSLYSRPSPEYENLHSFLNPQTPARLHWASYLGFLGQSVYYILRYSLENLRQGILHGQYHRPKGVYFGGTQAQPQRAVVDLLLQEWASSYERIFIIDIHTGYGQRGRLHFLSASEADPQAARLNEIFGESAVDFGTQKKFYQVEGDFIAFCLHRLRNDFQRRAEGVAFEFGTLDSQKTLGSIESLRRTVLENQGWHNQFANEKDEKEIRYLFREMFYPSEIAWRESALKQAQTAWNHVITYFSNSPR